MKSEQGNIEMLLVLCCLVGVVAFFCLSFAMTATLNKPVTANELMRRWQELQKVKKEQEMILKRLQQEKKQLVEQSTQQVADKIKQKNKESELKRLNEEYRLLQQEIEDLRKKMAALPEPADPQQKQQLEDELMILEKKLSGLEKEIREKSQLLPSEDGRTDAQITADKVNALQRELEQLGQQRSHLEATREMLRAKMLTAGASAFNHPIYVECRKTVYVFYPQAESVSVAELEQRNIFKDKTVGHDVVVLYVRPDGIESFKKAYNRIKAINIKLSYEPIEADQSLDFLKETRG